MEMKAAIPCEGLQCKSSTCLVPSGDRCSMLAQSLNGSLNGLSMVCLSSWSLCSIQVSLFSSSFFPNSLSRFSVLWFLLSLFLDSFSAIQFVLLSFIGDFARTVPRFYQRVQCYGVMKSWSRFMQGNGCKIHCTFLSSFGFFFLGSHVGLLPSKRGLSCCHSVKIALKSNVGKQTF